MIDLVDLFAANEKSLKNVATEIERLGKSAEHEKERYINAAEEEKTAFKDIWEAAVREKEAARRNEEALLAERKALIERLPTAGNDVLERVQKVEAALGASRGLFTTVFKFLPSLSSSTEPQQPKRKRKEEREAFRTAAFDHYNAWEEGGANVRLHFPEVSVPKAHACAAHIFARRWGPHMPEHLDMEDVDSPTNALVLLKPIRMAFDKGQLIFLYDAAKNSLFMKLLDKSIASTTMAEASAAYDKDPFSYIPHLPWAVAAMTFEDCDGLPLTFPNLAPAKRCLDFHARLAVLNAEMEDWIDEGEVEVTSYGSEGEYKDRLELLLGKMDD